MNFYEGLFVLDIQGKDEGLKEALTSVEKEITSLGGKIKGTQKMDKRRFERIAGNLDSGFYVNIQFQLDPAKVDALNKKLSLNEVVYRQFYVRKEEFSEVAAA
jgi:small subunit ribosomal protein S6